MRGPVTIAGITHSFGKSRVLDDVSLSIPAGSYSVLLGPSGSGKTTLLSILAGITSPDSGEVSHPGSGVGWVPQQAALYRRLTVTENLKLFARLQGHEDPDASTGEMIELTGLGERSDDQVGTLSGGNQQRVNIAVGLMARPDVLLLDEPSVGLDPGQRARLWEFILGLVSAGTAVLFSTHDIQEAERYAGRILVIAGGERVFDGTADGLRTAVTDAGGADAGDLETSFLAFLDGDRSTAPPAGPGDAP